jgi:hypothetical protein
MKKMVERSNVFVVLFALLMPLRLFAADSPLRGEMDGINRSVRALNRQYTDPSKKASSLELVAALQKHAETAKTLPPPKANTGTAEEKTKYLDTFHKDLDKLLVEIAALKDAIAADKTDVAKAEIDKIGQLKASSHKELGVDLGGGGKRGGPPPAGQ